MSDGVPTPTLTWYSPDGNEIKKVTATQNTVNVQMNMYQDFGGYKCDADNGLTPADYKIVKIEQISRCCLSYFQNCVYANFWFLLQERRSYQMNCNLQFSTGCIKLALNKWFNVEWM